MGKLSYKLAVTGMGVSPTRQMKEWLLLVSEPCRNLSKSDPIACLVVGLTS
jgi:hypothetical protein